MEVAGGYGGDEAEGITMTKLMDNVDLGGTNWKSILCSLFMIADLVSYERKMRTFKATEKCRRFLETYNQLDD